jgi:hypothetical protein
MQYWTILSISLMARRVGKTVKAGRTTVPERMTLQARHNIRPYRIPLRQSNKQPHHLVVGMDTNAGRMNTTIWFCVLENETRHALRNCPIVELATSLILSGRIAYRCELSINVNHSLYDSFADDAAHSTHQPKTYCRRPSDRP